MSEDCALSQSATTVPEDAPVCDRNDATKMPITAFDPVAPERSKLSRKLSFRDNKGSKPKPRASSVPASSGRSYGKGSDIGSMRARIGGRVVDFSQGVDVRRAGSSAGGGSGDDGAGGGGSKKKKAVKGESTELRFLPRILHSIPSAIISCPRSDQPWAPNRETLTAHTHQHLKKQYLIHDKTLRH